MLYILGNDAHEPKHNETMNNNRQFIHPARD